MNWAIFPSGNSDAAQRCVNAWSAVGWLTAVLIDADQKPVECDHLLQAEVYRGTAWSFNALIATIGEFNIVACINDDMYPVDCPAAAAEQYMHAAFKGWDGILQPTGIRTPAMDWCSPCPIIGKDYVKASPLERVWHPGYYHLHCDQEIRDVAVRLRKYAEIKSLSVEHRHHASGFPDTLPPEKRAANNARHESDRQLYEERRAAGFPGARLI